MEDKAICHEVAKALWTQRKHDEHCVDNELDTPRSRYIKKMHFVSSLCIFISSCLRGRKLLFTLKISPFPCLYKFVPGYRVKDVLRTVLATVELLLRSLPLYIT